MLAYEFITKPKNGVIPIPEQYKSLITDNVMVIVLPNLSWNNNGAANVRKKTDLLSPPTMKTKGFKFNREEANYR